MSMRPLAASVAILISTFAITVAVADKAPIDWPTPGTTAVAAPSTKAIDWPTPAPAIVTARSNNAIDWP
ncbi:hypothetical protein QCN29_34880 [Streptomyces sp. HNM0663]|uniref:Uncharacterized protein n=1 Tax=Streptomyces chengmaiensis TaxID=3040919 RepID=A0ABT6HYT8_9ACTN|nr:hypothetical protein [Streptomyces chengmaiensis]MDH2393852.1 hypothetical protein [Streptomyces chengmaiensis]